jgi:thiamine-monophosphate kinase
VTDLADIGERKAIQIITKMLSQDEAIVGIGDDCAAFNFGDEYLLVTTDLISEKTHIPVNMTPFQLGWFIVAINLSDIAAKGGIPLGLVLSYGLPKKTTKTFLKELTNGADSCSTKYYTTIVGGDTKESSDITLCGTALGIVKKEHFMSRKGAIPDDIIAVTGTLGKAGAGYYSLKNKIFDYDLSKGLLEPIPRLKEGILLSNQKSVTSSMDISDGLSSSLYQMKEINNIGFEIDIRMIPIAPELIQLHKKIIDLEVSDIALHFGGDYELLVTIPPDKFKSVQETMNNNKASLIEIGKVTEKKEIVINNGETKKPLENKGYEHFKNHFF